jgi:ribonuclease HI
MTGTKKQFYAVLKGRQPGIYLRWSGTGGAEEQVKGYPGAVFKGFTNREDAESYIRSGGQTAVVQPELVSLPKVETPAPRNNSIPEYQADLAAGKVVIFTDGASTGNPGPGGYGVVLLYGDTRNELSGGFRRTTNNRMELLACITGLKELKRPVPAVLYSDSRYVVNGVEQGWARRWKKNGWMRPPDRQGRVFRAENTDLWAELLDLLDLQPVEFRWVKGHASNPENERCDQLAVQASRQRGLPEDVGFQ